MTKKQENLQKKIDKMPFEEAIERLEEVAESMSSSNIALDEMIQLYEEGQILKKHCQKRLDEAKMKVEQVV